MSEEVFNDLIERAAILSANIKPYGRGQLFDGATFDYQKDYMRLNGQLARVYNWMSDGRWRTLGELKNLAGGTEAALSARLRDLRKRRFGGHTVNRRRRANSNGLWEYQLIVNG